MAPQFNYHHHHHINSPLASPSFTPYSIPGTKGKEEYSKAIGGVQPSISSSLPTQTNSHNSDPPKLAGGSSGLGAPVTYFSRKFVARRISEGETGRLKEELKCQACGKGYKHISSLAKHLWEHTPEWSMTSKLSISKHQQVQLLEAASILVSMNEEDETYTENKDSSVVDVSGHSFITEENEKAQIHDGKQSLANQHMILDIEDESCLELLKSPFTSPSLADDSSTPSPPPHPLTPQFPVTRHPIRSKDIPNSNMSNSTQVLSNNISKMGNIYSRSSSLTSHSCYPSSPSSMPSSTIVTDLMYPTILTSLSSNNQALLSSSLTSIHSSTRYDEVVSADSIRKRHPQRLRQHSTRPYSRRMSALNPPSRVNVKLSLDSDDENYDDENAVEDDVDDGVFGAMD